MKRRGFLRLAVLLGAPSVTFAGSAQADPGDPEAFIRATQTELQALVQKPESAEVDKKIAELFDRMLDYDRLAKESLGSHWEARSEEERKEFQRILTGLVRNAYRRNLKKTANYVVDYLGSSKEDESHRVRTVARDQKDARKEPISIDYVLHRLSAGWKIYDMVTDGSSMVRNYRSQFGRVIKKDGFDELLRKMRDKLKKKED